MSLPPQLSNEERRAALEKAARARKARALFKLEVKQRRRNWIEAFTHEDEAIRKMRVKELLLSLPGFGEIRALNVMDQAGISLTRRVQGVGKSQYETLLKILKEES
ncbi:MAG: integration host factor, actinobacterial type [Candidatus Nanopelagicaceae bacterium]